MKMNFLRLAKVSKMFFVLSTKRDFRKNGENKSVSLTGTRLYIDKYFQKSIVRKLFSVVIISYAIFVIFLVRDESFL